MAQLVKAMVRVWETYDSIQRGNSTFKLAVLGGWGGATDPGDQSHFKDSLIRVRDNTVYPLVEQKKYVEAFKWIMIQKGVVDRQAKEVGDYDSDLDLGYSRLSVAANLVQVALVSMVPVAGEAAIAGGAGVWAVGGTAVAAGGVGAGAAEMGRQSLAGEERNWSKIGKAAYTGSVVVGTSAVAPAATRSLGKVIALGQKGTALVGANALAAGTVNTALTMAGGGDGLEAFAGGFVGSIGGTATSQALGPLAENPIVKTGVAGGVGAGTAALIGADPKAGFVGGVSSVLGEAAKTGGPGTPHGTNVEETTVSGEKTAASAEPPMQVSVDPTERVVDTEPVGRANEPEPPDTATSIDKGSGKAEKPTAGGHEVVVTEAGIGVCSPSPCPVIHVEYKNELKANRELQKAYKRVQALRKVNPQRAAELADLLIRNLEKVRSNYGGRVEPPPFASKDQRSRINAAVKLASELSEGSFKADEFNEYLKSAKSPRQLESMIADIEARIEDKVETSSAALRTDHQPGTANKDRLGRATHERVLGRGMEEEGGAIPLDHDRHHVAPKRGGGKLGERIRELLGIAGVSVDDPANGIPLAGHARDPRAVQESSFPHNRAHTRPRLQELLRDLETVRGDAKGTRDVLRRHAQDLYEARTRDSNEDEFRFGPDPDDLDHE
jgi:hypothetical protein